MRALPVMVNKDSFEWTGVTVVRMKSRPYPE